MGTQGKTWQRLDLQSKLQGKTFGRLRAIKMTDRKKNNQILWECECICGQMTHARSGDLTTGHKKSCGCLHLENPSAKKHGQSSPLTPEYNAWRNMFARCYYPGYIQFKDYGGRGITVCERWQKFETFITDMGPRPSSDHSIDRIDNDGNYTPKNCRWATRKEQVANRRVKPSKKPLPKTVRVRTSEPQGTAR